MYREDQAGWTRSLSSQVANIVHPESVGFGVRHHERGKEWTTIGHEGGLNDSSNADR